MSFNDVALSVIVPNPANPLNRLSQVVERRACYSKVTHVAGLVLAVGGPLVGLITFPLDFNFGGKLVVSAIAWGGPAAGGSLAISLDWAPGRTTCLKALKVSLRLFGTFLASFGAVSVYSVNPQDLPIPLFIIGTGIALGPEIYYGGVKINNWVNRGESSGVRALYKRSPEQEHALQMEVWSTAAKLRYTLAVITFFGSIATMNSLCNNIIWNTAVDYKVTHIVSSFCAAAMVVGLAIACPLNWEARLSMMTKIFIRALGGAIGLLSYFTIETQSKDGDVQCRNVNNMIAPLWIAGTVFAFIPEFRQLWHTRPGNKLESNSVNEMYQQLEEEKKDST